MKNNSEHRVSKSIVRVTYILLIYLAYKSSCTVTQLILLSSECILFAPVADFIVDKISDDI